MPVDVTDYVDVDSRMAQLGCHAGTGLTILPSNFSEAASPAEFLMSGTAPTIIKVLGRGGVQAGLLQADTTPPGFIHNKSHDWVVPAIYISAELMKTSPDLVSVAVDLIKDYAVSLYKGISDKKTIKAEIVIEQTNGHTYKRLSYEGDVEGLQQLAQVAKDVYGSDQGQ
jgi:hypothetical protein